MEPAMITKRSFLILLNLILLAAVHQTRADNPRSELFKIDDSMSGKVFNDLLLFEVQAYTNKRCILMCLDHGACIAVTMTSSALTSQVTCRGHAGSSVQKLTPQSASVAKADTVFYYKNVMSVWLYKGCSQNGDCGVVNAQCVTGQCVCQPDFFYSEGQDTCVSTCQNADLQTNYLIYRDMDFYFGAIDVKITVCTSTTDQERELECQRGCNAVSGSSMCFDVVLGRAVGEPWKCYNKNKFTSTHSLVQVDGVVFMKRTCI